MSVTVSDVVYGCDVTLEKRAEGLREAGKAMCEILRASGTLPTTWTAKGIVYAVVKINVTPDGTTDNRTALNTAMNTSRSGVDTILVLPPTTTHYRYSNILNLSANTYLVGYGATVEPTGVINYAHVFNGNNAGICGVRMLGHHSTYSKWPERFWDDPTAGGNGVQGQPAKNGSISDTNGGGVTNDAWVVTSGRSNVIVMDNIAYGSLTGFVRCWGSGNQHLYEGNFCRRTHSDSIHLTQGSTFMTARRNRIVDSGDDAISVVSYNKTENPAPPGNILVEYNEITGGRARGLTVVGGFNVLHQYNTVENTTLAPFYYAVITAGAGLSHNVTALNRNNRVYRGGRRQSQFTQNGIYATCLCQTGGTVVVTVQDNECNTYGEYLAAEGDFVRTATGVTATESGNTLRAITSST